MSIPTGIWQQINRFRKDASFFLTDQYEQLACFYICISKFQKLSNGDILELSDL